MNFHDRNAFIAKHEDDELNRHLDREDAPEKSVCGWCDCRVPDGKRVCQECEEWVKEEDNGPN